MHTCGMIQLFICRKNYGNIYFRSLDKDIGPPTVAHFWPSCNVPDVKTQKLKETIMDLPTAKNDTVIATKFEQIFDMIEVKKLHMSK